MGAKLAEPPKTKPEVKEILTRPADKKWGYKFGCDGLMSKREACEFLGNMSDDVLQQLYEKEKIRKGKMPGGQMVFFCRRSVEEFAHSTEL